MTAIVTVQAAEKSFGLRRILNGVSFAVHDQDRIGLVGVNGSGKTTLLKIILGDEAPDVGKITRKRGLTIEYVAQEPKLDPARSVVDTLREGLRAHAAEIAALDSLAHEIPNLTGGALDEALAAQAAAHGRVMDLGGWDQDHEIRGLSAALELPPMDSAVGTLSLGERRRVAVARALLARPELLALDEPTNHLDARTTAWLEGRLIAQGGALLLVTHDRYFLDRVATRILELDRGRIHSYDGGYASFLEKQADRLEKESKRERDRASFVRRELDWVRRGPAARSTKQKARLDRFDAAVSAKPQAGERLGGPAVLKLATGARLGKTVLELRGVSKKSPAGKPLFKDLSLIWKPGDRIGVVGRNGAGKTTLVRTILGETPPDSGEVIIGVNTKFSFLDQGRADLREDLTVLQEVSGDNEHVFLADGPVHARTFLRMLLFDDGFADTPVSALSGGERNRVQLAKLLRSGGNFLILDEPTNDLDLVTLGVLEEALADFGGCALVVSHDRWFLDRVATGILAFEGDGEVAFYEGNCTDYLARAREPKVDPAAPVVTPAPPRAVASSPPPPKPRRMSFKEKQELAGLEARITGAEAKVAELEQTLQDPSIYQTRGAEVPGLVAALDAARVDVETLYARWQELESLPT